MEDKEELTRLLKWEREGNIYENTKTTKYRKLTRAKKEEDRKYIKRKTQKTEVQDGIGYRKSDIEGYS